MTYARRGFHVQDNTGFFGEKFRRAGLVGTAKGSVYPFAAVTAPAYPWKELSR